MRIVKVFLVLAAAWLPLWTIASAPVAWDGGGDGTNWNHALNWSGDSVPAATNDVVIDVPGTNTIVFISSGNITVRSLQCQESLILGAGTFAVTTGASEIAAALTLARGTSLTARGSNTVFGVLGSTKVDGASLYVQDGATVSLPGLAAYSDTAGCCGTRWEARGAGSVLRLHGMTNFTGNPTIGWDTELFALAGGRIEAGSLPDVNGSISVLVDGSNSVIDLAGLQRVNGGRLLLEARNGGNVPVPSLTDGSRVGITLRAGGTMSTTQFTRLNSVLADAIAVDLSVVNQMTVDGAVTLQNGGTVNLNSVTNVNGVNFYVYGGVILTLPQVRSYADSAGCCGTRWDVRGAGSMLRMPALTNFAGNPTVGWDTELWTLSGGRLELQNLPIISSGAVSAVADGTNSVIDLSGLQQVSASRLLLEARNDGSILIPQVTDGSRVSLTLRSRGNIPTAQLTHLASVIADGVAIDLSAVRRLSSQAVVTLLNSGTVNLNSVTNIDGMSFYVRTQSTLSLPSVGTYVDTSGCCGAEWEASVAGAQLALPGLTNLTGNPTWAMQVRALNGGTIQLGAMLRASALVGFFANGSNSVVHLTNLREFLGASGSSGLTLQSGGVIHVPVLGRLNRGYITLNAGGAIDLSSLTNIDGTSLFARAGERLAVSNIASYADTSGCCGATWEANGAGSRVLLPALTNLAGNPTWAMTVQALAGGLVDLGEVTGIPDSDISFLANGSNSVVVLTNVQEFRGSSGLLAMTVQSGGAIRVPQLTRMNRGVVTLNAGGLLDLTALTNVNGSSFYVRAGEQLSLPNIHAYVDTSGCCGAVWETHGAGSRFRLPALVSLAGNPTWTMTVQALAGGELDIGSVNTIPDSNLHVLADGTNSVVDLSSLGEYAGVGNTLTLEARNRGTILLDALTRLNRTALILRNTGVLPTAQLEAITSSTVTIDGRTVAFPALTDIRGTTFVYQNGGTAIFPAASDLAVTNIDAPGASSAGLPVQLVWTVSNLGTNAAIGPRTDTVYLSTDAAIGNDQLLAQFPVSEAISAGGAQFVTNTVIIPPGITGNRYFVVHADSGHHIYEGTNEANNIAVDNQPVVISAADLVVDAVSAPTNALFGQSITVAWQVRNAGSMNAAAPFSDRVYLSTNTSVSSGAILLRTVASTSLAAGAAYTRTQTVALPLSAIIAGGTWFIVVRTDGSNLQAESNENNNTRASGAMQIARPPLPDLVVENVVAPGSAQPGQPISITWQVTNQGSARVSNVWSEVVVLNNITLAFLPFTTDLPIGASVSRTQSVTIPITGPAGDLRFSVEVDRGDQVVESSEINNLTLAPNTTAVPLTLSLSLPLTQAAENTVMLGRISRNGPLSQSLAVSLSSSAGDELAMPSSVTIPANVASTTFDVMALPDGLVDGPQAVTILATAPDFLSASNNVVVLDSDTPRLLLTVSSGLLIEDQIVAGTMTREGDLSEALVITLASSSSGQISLPGTVTIAAGEASATFPVLAVDDYYVESTRTYSLTATAQGHQSASTSVIVQDDDLPPLSLDLDQTRVTEGAGATLTIRREFETVTPLQVRIMRSHGDQLNSPELVEFNTGELAIYVPLSVVDDSVLESNLTVTLVVEPLETLSLNPIPPGVTTNIIIVDDDGPSLQLSLARDWLCSTGSVLSELTALLIRHGNTNAPVTATLSVDVPGLVDFPATLDFQANETAISFTVSAQAVMLALPRTVTLTATAFGYIEAATSFLLTPDCGPDLVISNIAIPSSGLTDSYFSASFREINIGGSFAIVSAPPGITNIAQKIYLSADRFPGGDTFLGSVLFDGAVDPYTYLDRTATFRFPSVPGDYWLVVEADGSNSVSEVSEANNLAVSATAIHVDPAYTATVSADVESALAGTVVGLSGTARRFGSAQPAPFEIVSLHIGLRGTTRVIAALTDANGNFSAAFTPLPGEAGTYTVGAAHPGVTNVPVQDTFTLLGMKATPASFTARLGAFTSVTQQVDLANLGDVPLSGITAAVIGAPPEFSVVATPPAALAPFANGTLALVLGVVADTNLTRTFTVRVTSAEGAIADVIVTLVAESLRPRLVVEPESLVAGVVPGGQRFVEFTVANQGGAPSSPLQVLIPPLSFLRVASPALLPALAPGESNMVTLQLVPAPGTTLGNYTGTIGLSGGASGVSVPFDFRVLSTNVGSLLIEVTDQFTYYAEGAPRVTNALVELRDPSSGQVITNLFSDTAGLAHFTDVTEGFYVLQITAREHEPYRRNIFVSAGDETYQEALLNREVVKFIWNVVPTEVGDRTKITIEAVFETVVPVPVLTVHPPVIDLANFPNGGTINLTVTNHGLLAAQQVRMFFSDFACWKITPLISDIGTLAARSSIVVPVTICRDLTCSGDFSACSGSSSVTAGGAEKNAAVQKVISLIEGSSGGGGNCGAGAVLFIIPCGIGAVGGSAPVGVANAGGDCEFHPVGGSASGSGSLGGTSAVGGAPCDPCGLELAKALALCALDFLLPLAFDDIENCVLDSASCAADVAEEGITTGSALECAGAVVSCLEAAGKELPGVGHALTALGCLDDILSACGGPGLAGALGFGGGAGPQQAFAFAQIMSANTYPGIGEVARAGEHLVSTLEVYSYFFGGGNWVRAMVDENFETWLQLFRADIANGSEASQRISAAESAALTNHPLAQQLSAPAINAFVARWNRTMDYYAAGIFYSTNVPAGQSSDFLAFDIFSARLTAASNAIAAARAAGFSNVLAEVRAATAQLRAVISQPSGGICARVRLRIEQEAVIARDAFRATLEIVNGTGSPLTNVAVDLVVYGPGGEVATSLFGIPAPDLDGLSAVDGTGRVNASSTGIAGWNILPTIDAAPAVPLQYYVGGSIRYVQDDVLVIVPLALVSITVHPLAQLHLTYFHQRDVFADDPFTDEIEPSVPYSLAVMVRNTGNGVARNLRITSAQPQIVENEKGLFIDFQIIATEVAGHNLVPSLTANFGDIDPSEIAIGRWLFKSTLQGLFIDYSATFEHLDNLGDPRLSLIQSVDIRELIRIVRAPGSFEDRLPDMLVNDFPDLDDLPDALYLSDGAVAPVSIVQTGMVAGALSPANLQVTLNAPLPAGWSYLRMPDPADGRYRLIRVVRSDAASLSVGTNVWTTDRTFVGGGRRPIKQNNLHLLDYDSTGAYTFIYEPLAGPDTVAPASSIAALPIVSGEQVPLIWSGTDNPEGSGIGFYDIFISINSGPFLPWLEHTLLTGTIYQGVQGNTYAFYSVATDVAGNREPSPLAPDAITAVNFTNTAPALAGGLLVVNEGDTARYTNTVVDPDVPPQSLSFAFIGSVPAGASLQPLTGVITWSTTEATGPATNVFTVRVTDNGFPSYSATGQVTIVVNEVNRRPTLSAIADRTIREGQLLLITNSAGDPDIPANALTFSLGSGAPAGATIHPSSGIFQWRPAEFQGGATNPIFVIVADNGQPSLSATQRFNLIVRDVLGDFELALGSATVLAGESNSVPLVLKSGLPLTGVDFLVEIPETKLSNLVLRATSPEVTALTLLPAGPNHFEITLDFDPDQAQGGIRSIGDLAFRALPVPDSAIVPLRLLSLSGARVDHQPITHASAIDGSVFLIAAQPLLDAQRAIPGHINLTLHGRPGNAYAIEYTSVLTASWQLGWTWPLTNITQTFTLPVTNQTLFWRAIEVGF